MPKKAPVKTTASKPTTRTARGTSGSGAGFHSSSSSRSSSSVSSTRDPWYGSNKCGGTWTQEQAAARDAKRAAWAAAGKAKVAKQQLKSKTKLSAAEVEERERTETWKAQKKERRDESRAWREERDRKAEENLRNWVPNGMERIREEGCSPTREEMKNFEEVERAIAGGPAAINVYLEEEGRRRTARLVASMKEEELKRRQQQQQQAESPPRRGCMTVFVASQMVSLLSFFLYFFLWCQVSPVWELYDFGTVLLTFRSSCRAA